MVGQRGSRVIFKGSFDYKYRRQKKYRQFKKIIFPALILIATASFAYFIFFSSFFTIRDIKIDGVKTLKADAIFEEIQKNFRQQSFIPKNNWFMTDEEVIHGDLQKLFPQISSVKIRKQLPGALYITIQEREMIGMYCLAQQPAAVSPQPTDENTEAVQKCFYIDGNGVIFGEAPQGSGSLVLKILDFSGREDVKLGSPVIEKEFLDKLNLADERLSKETNINTREIELMGGGDIRVKSDQNFIIYFNANRDIQNQILALREILTQKITPEDKTKLEYIDLRVEGRVYYK